MIQNVIFSSVLNPPILFFGLGFLATVLRTGLEIPPPLGQFFSLYVLLAIGFQGGYEVSYSPITTNVWLIFFIAIIAASLLTILNYLFLRMNFLIKDAAAIAASYGSVSVLTFVAATSFLSSFFVPYDGFMVACLALMETPAIIVAVLLYYHYGETDKKISFASVLHHAILNNAVVLILGSFVIGLIAPHSTVGSITPFFIDMFKGMLCFFLLDIGIIVAKRIRSLLNKGTTPFLYATILPLVNAVIAICIAYATGFKQGNAFLFTVLCASASYIAVPAALRLAIPLADPGLYVPMALGVTFPLNIIIGLPVYFVIIQYLWGA